MWDIYNAIHTFLWVGGGIIAVLVAAGIFAALYPWQSDPLNLTRWL
jgi:hypothetical protein